MFLRSSASRKGAELLEFTLVLLPLLGLVTVLVDTAWAIFATSTLQRAVRIGVRTGVTLTVADMAPGDNLTNTVKGVVQQNALGMLKGTSGLAKIKVNYYLPPDDGSSSPVTDVSAQSSGNAPGNIMKVSVQNFSLAPLMPRIFIGGNDNAPLSISVSSADVIEPSNNRPAIGPAP